MSTEEILQGFGSIQFLAGPLKDQVFPLDKEVVTIGSDASNDVVIKDDAGVSRFHAWLMWSERGWSIQRHAQAGVVTVNALAVEQAMIGEQVTVRLGKNTSFRVVASTAPIRLDPAPTQVGDTGAINRAPTVEHKEEEGAINRAPTVEHMEGEGTINRAPTVGGEELESTLIAHVDDKTLPLKPSVPGSLAHVAGLSAHPDTTQITPPAALGIPSLEIGSNASGEMIS
ncbi:MAG: FHA domain-containing protein [Chloroflexi bacterium]|nr:MAG: FHA domain-containing protein [Chloroflexota bacterium]